MKSKIIIELDRIDDLPDSGSRMADLGYDAYFVKREILKLEWTEKKTGNVHQLGEKYTVGTLRTEST